MPTFLTDQQIERYDEARKRALEDHMPTLDTRSATGRALGSLVDMYEREVHPFEIVGETDLSRAPMARPHIALPRIVRYENGTPIRQALCAHCDWQSAEHRGGNVQSPQAHAAEADGQRHTEIANEQEA